MSRTLSRKTSQMARSCRCSSWVSRQLTDCVRQCRLRSAMAATLAALAPAVWCFVAIPGRTVLAVLLFHRGPVDLAPVFSCWCLRGGRGLHGEALQDGNQAVEQCRSEEHTSELQSRLHLVCRLLLEKKNKNKQ